MTLKGNTGYFLFLGLIIFFTFFNTLNNEFSLIDDYAGFVSNPKLDSVIDAVATYDFQTYLFFLSKVFFGINPIPLHALSLTLHFFNVALVFLLASGLFDKKTGLVSSVIFAVHPLVTEPVNWISGMPHLIIAFVTFLTSYLLFRYRLRNKKMNLYISLFIFCFFGFFYRTVWFLTIPAFLFVFDYFVLGTGMKSVLKIASIFGIVSAILAFFFLGPQAFQSLSIIRNDQNVLLNSQALTPIVQTYPFTIFNTTRLLVLPYYLSFYYDGFKISNNYLLIMYSVTLLVIGLAAYLFKRDKRLFGIILLVFVSTLPSFSFNTDVWTLAERYLYRSVAMYGILIGFLVSQINISSVFYYKKLLLGLFLVYTLFLIQRTILRNDVWDNPRVFAIAHIITAPYSPRPYADLGSYYHINRDFDNAYENYRKSLEILPGYENSVRNIGVLYLQYGVPEYVVSDANLLPDQKLAEHYKKWGYSYLNSDIKTLGVYYLVESLRFGFDEEVAHDLDLLVPGSIERPNTDL